jgi:hypothetical protein
MNVRLLGLCLLHLTSCSSNSAEGEGEVAEGEGEVAEGEGEVAEGEGEVAEGEGEAAEGEGEVAEGEGDAAEGEGDAAEGEGEASIDCNAPLPFDVNRRSMPNVRSYHGLGFATDNTIVGWDPNSGNIEKTTRSGQSSLFVPSVDGVEQIDTAPNGDILAVQRSQLLRINADGVGQRVGGDLNGAYGVTIGPDGNAYVSGDGGVVRINLTTEETTLVVSPNVIARAHDVDFSLDSRTLYVATIQEQLWAIPLDDDLNTAGPPVEVSPGFDGWMDAVVVDECGYLWVPEYFSATLYRFNPATGDQECYTHGVTFGVDAGGWNHRALYMPRPYAGGEAVEVEVGIRAGKYARTYLGVPQQVPPPGPREVGDETCDNGVDDDGDFVADCDDTDCDGPGACGEVCDNGQDDDGDFARDCSDPDCAATPSCGPLQVSFDLGDVDNPSMVALPFSEVVENAQVGGQECLSIVVDMPTDLTARTDSNGCRSRENGADTELQLYRDGNQIDGNDDGPDGFCSLLETQLDPGSYVLCVRTLQQFGPQPLLPIRLEVSTSL